MVLSSQFSALTGNMIGEGRNPGVFRGEVFFYKSPEHTALLLEGLRKAGIRSDAEGAS